MLNHLIQHIAFRLRDREEGQTFVEYGLIIGAVSIGMLIAFTGLTGVFEGLVDSVSSAIGGGGGEEE